MPLRGSRSTRNTTVSQSPKARPDAPPPGTRAEARETQRQRLLDAMAVLVGLHGYGAVSVAQVIEAAGVSRKTYYEYFDDKLDCFLEAYEAATTRLIEVLRQPTEAGAGSRTERQLARYLAAIAANPVLARAFIVEVMGAGERALVARERVNRRFADLVFAHVSPDAQVRKAFIGGVNDVVTGELLAGRKRLGALLPALLRFVEGPGTSAQPTAGAPRPRHGRSAGETAQGPGSAG